MLQKKEKGRSWVGVISGGAMLLSMVTLILGGSYAWFFQKQFEQEKKRAIETQVSLMQLKNNDASVSMRQQDIEKLKSAIEASLSQQITLKEQHEWGAIHANYLVLMANERLKIAHDVPTALTLLQYADKTLAPLAPQYSDMRKQLAKDIATLSAIPVIDRQAIWIKIASLMPLIESLSFQTAAQKEKPTEENVTVQNKVPSKWKQSVLHAWQELKGMIQISKEENNRLPQALVIEDKVQIIHMMQYLCEQAQWAMLHEQAQIYEKSLIMLQKQIKQYFAQNEQQIKVLAQIQALVQQKVTVVYPELSTAVMGANS